MTSWKPTWPFVAFCGLCVAGLAIICTFTGWSVSRGYLDAHDTFGPIKELIIAAALVVAAYLRGLNKPPPAPEGLKWSLTPSLSPPPSDDELTGQHRLPRAAPVPPDVAPVFIPSITVADELAGPFDAITPAETPAAKRPVPPPAPKGRS